MSAQNDSNMIISASEFKSETNMSYNKPKINKAGGKSVPIINKSSNRHLHLSMPLMLTWGVNQRVDESTGRVSYDMSLQFPNDDYATEETRAVLDSFVAMEEQVKKDAISNSLLWFNKPKLTEAQVDVLFNPMLYWPKDKQTGERRGGSAPTLRVKLDCWDGLFKCEIYDVEQNTIYPSKNELPVTPMELITKGCNVATIIKCGGVYFVNGKFGVTWRLHQALVKPKESISGKCFIKLSPQDISLMNVQRNETEFGEEDKEHAEIVESDDEIEAKREEVKEVNDTKDEPVKKKVLRRKA
jgi:hypothetical protein